MSSGLSVLGFLQNIGLPEMIVIAMIALILFGRRLPEVGRSLGKGIVEFKKGLREIEDDVSKASNEAPSGGKVAGPQEKQGGG